MLKFLLQELLFWALVLLILLPMVLRAYSKYRKDDES